MALVPRSGGTRLVQVHAVSAGYPFYGDIVTDPAAAWATASERRVTPSSIPRCSSRSTRSSATRSRSARAKFVITGSLRSVPGDVGIAAAIGPRVYIPERYRSGDAAASSSAAAPSTRRCSSCRPTLDAATRSSKRLRQASRGGQRLGAAARATTSRDSPARSTSCTTSSASSGSIALLLGGIGVASGVHAFVMRKIDTVAILRCLGATSWQVLAIYTCRRR